MARAKVWECEGSAAGAALRLGGDGLQGQETQSIFTPNDIVLD